MLTLPIKRKWFDMIVSGEKREEYRKITPYYTSRLGRYLALTIRFRAGYSNDSPTIECPVVIEKGWGKPEWGAFRGIQYYIIKILDVRMVEKGFLIMDSPISEWFELSYAQFLTVPRLVMESMPMYWQKKMAEIL